MMSFAVRLASDTIVVEAGATSTVSVVVECRTAEIDRYELEVQGVDAEWLAVPVPTFSVDPGVDHSEKFFFRPPRESESKAGGYPFVVKVRSLVSGESRSVQGVLEIRPFHFLSMEINPKKGFISPLKHQNSFGVTLMNLGNTDHTVRMTGGDPEDALAYDFDVQEFTVGAGQQREVEVVTTPKRSMLISTGRLIGFSISARSVSHSTVSTSAQAQLEQRSMVSPGSLVLLLGALFVFGLWYLNMPRPPQLAAFTVEPQEVVAGEPVSISWSSPDATLVQIRQNDEIVVDSNNRSGTHRFRIPAGFEGSSIEFAATPVRNDLRGVTGRVTIRVTQPVIVPEPTIGDLRVTPTRVRLGQPFLLSYRFGPSVSRAVLGPINAALDPALPSLEVTPSMTGRLTYTVVAYNTAGKSASKSFTVDVFEESDARILEFVVKPGEVFPDENAATLTWQVSNAVRVALTAQGGEAPRIDGRAFLGSVEVRPTETTTYTLTAFDEQGRTTTATARVTIKQRPQPEGPAAYPIQDEASTPGGVTPPPATGGGF